MADNDLLRLDPPTDTPFPLGRHVWHDPQNRQHRALARAETLPDRSRMWASPDVYHQRGSSCTMQSNVGMCMSYPHRQKFKKWFHLYDTEEERHAAYLLAQNLDPWPGGEPQYEGSSSDAPLKLMRERGHIAEWRWLFGFDEVKQWIMYHGPCVVGTTWYTSFFYPEKGFMRLDESQGTSGGHAWRIVGYSVRRRAFRMVNSWGRGWGEAGRAWVHEDVLRRLLAEQGEAVTLVIGN